jgi:hypothetical protein
VLREEGGKNTLTNTVAYSSREARDTALKSGMTRGIAASYDRLAELLASGEVRAKQNNCQRNRAGQS